MSADVCRIVPSPLAAATRCGHGDWPCGAFEQRQQGRRDKSCSRRIDVSVALHILAMNEQALRHDKMQAVLGPGHGDMEQAAFLVDVRRCSGAEIGRNAAVNDIQHEDGFPLLPFGRMDRREDQIVLIQHRHPWLIARGIRRVERQLGQEAARDG